MPRVIVLGSINTDLTMLLPRLPAPGETLLGGEFRSGPGGKGANQAVAARRAGAEVVLVAAVGDDAHGRGALEGYRGEGIDVGHVRVIPGVATGVALIFVGGHRHGEGDGDSDGGGGGENLIGVAPGANARLTPADIDHLPEALFDPAAVFLAGLEVPAATVARGVDRARRAGMTVVLNPAPADPALLDLDVLRHVDVLTPNRGEAGALAGLPVEGLDDAARAAEALRGLGPKAVIITMGADGYILATEGATARVAAFPAVPIDTVGAGDAFNGVLAAGLAEGLPLAEAARRASAAAALAVARAGAQAAIPDRDAIDNFLRDRSA